MSVCSTGAVCTDPARPACASNAAPWVPTIASTSEEVVAHEGVNAEYRRLAVRAGLPAANALAGQFFQLLCPGSAHGDPFLRRPMSLYGANPATGTVEFLYKVSGVGTHGLATLKVGDSLDIMGPLGIGYTLNPACQHIVVVGRGVGLATLAPLAKEASQRGIGVTAVFSARRRDLLMSVDLFERHGATVVSVTDDEGNSGPAHVEQILRGLIAERRCDAFYTCGSSRLARVQQNLAVEFNLPGQVALEQQMACGLGFCYCCVRDFNVGGQIVHKRVCCEGPVFDIREALT